jgi:hypothetical protein
VNFAGEPRLDDGGGKKKKRRDTNSFALNGKDDVLDFASTFSSLATNMAARLGARSDVEAVKRCTATARQASSSSRHYCSSLTAQFPPSFYLDFVQKLDHLQKQKLFIFLRSPTSLKSPTSNSH